MAVMVMVPISLLLLIWLVPNTSLVSIAILATNLPTINPEAVI